MRNLQILITLVLVTLSSFSYSQCGGPAPLLCDADGNRDVDSRDIDAITLAKGTPSTGPGDIRDIDGDGMVTVLDARLCVAHCSLPECSDGSSTAYYIDCDSTTASEGTIDAPWNNLEDANAIVLQPGDRLLLRRGTTCNGMLKPQGSGTADKRIVIGAYGEGPLPRIDAMGTNTAALHIEDMSHLVVRDLELTNPGDLDEPHRGVYLTALETVVTNVEIRDLYIHDVTGLVKFSGTGKSGGAIIAEALGSPGRNLMACSSRTTGLRTSAAAASSSSGPRQGTGPWPRSRGPKEARVSSSVGIT